MGLIISLPVLMVAALVIKLTSPGPVLFKQTRIGKNGRPFTLYKLRTMTVNHRGPGITTGGDPRVTRVGRWLRYLKIDEIPELWNVVRGDMALVGPRPEVPEFVDLNHPWWQRVLAVRPGIMDPVTVALRNEEALLAGVDGDPVRYYREVLLPKKLDGYLTYLEHRTFWSDILVILKTIKAILVAGA